MGIIKKEVEDGENNLIPNGRGVATSKTPLPRESHNSDSTTSPTQRASACWSQPWKGERKLKKFFI